MERKFNKGDKINIWLCQRFIWSKKQEEKAEISVLRTDRKEGRNETSSDHHIQ